jgi:hypothetical protein
VCRAFRLKTGIDDSVEMERAPVDSSVIVSVGDDESRRILELEYVDGDVYQYFDVPKALLWSANTLRCL